MNLNSIPTIVSKKEKKINQEVKEEVDNNQEIKYQEFIYNLEDVRSEIIDCFGYEHSKEFYHIDCYYGDTNNDEETDEEEEELEIKLKKGKTKGDYTFATDLERTTEGLRGKVLTIGAKSNLKPRIKISACTQILEQETEVQEDFKWRSNRGELVQGLEIGIKEDTINTKQVVRNKRKKKKITSGQTSEEYRKICAIKLGFKEAYARAGYTYRE